MSELYWWRAKVSVVLCQLFYFVWHCRWNVPQVCLQSSTCKWL